MFVLLLFFTLVALVVVSWINLLLDSKKTNVRGDFPLPLLGNAYDFMVDSVEFMKVLRRLAEKYNDAARFYLFSHRYMVLSHPKYIEPLLSSSELITKGKSYNNLFDWLGRGLLTSTGVRWRTHRKLLTPAFHFNILQNFLPVFCKNDKILCNKLKALSESGDSVNVFPLVALAALDSVTESIMGVSINAQKDEDSSYVKSLEAVAEIVSYRIRNPFLANETIFRFTSYKRRQDQALKVLHGQTRKVIEARKQELAKSNVTSLGNSSELGIRNRHAFLDILLLSEVNGQRLDDEKIREEVDTFMFEGHDTTTSGISFCLYNISIYETVQKKLYEEQKAILGDEMDRDPTFSEFRDMKYLDLVIKESLRVFPSVTIIERKMTQDADLGGLFVPQNTNVIINLFDALRNPQVYADPLAFIPERFETANREANSAYNWTPFSAGPRNCIGQKFAILEMKVLISAVVRHFYLLPSGRAPVLYSDLVLRARDGLYVNFKPRN